MTQRYDGAIITVRSDSITALVASLRWEFCKKGEWCGAVFRNFAKQILHLLEDHPEFDWNSFEISNVHFKACSWSPGLRHSNSLKCGQATIF